MYLTKKERLDPKTVKIFKLSLPIIGHESVMQ